MRSVRPTVEGAFLSALTVVLYLASIYIPVLGILVSFLCPLPVMFLVIRWGVRIGFLASVVASILVFGFAGLMQAVTCLVGFSLLGIAMGTTIRRRYALFEVLALNTGISLLSKLALVGIALVVVGKNPLTENIRFLEEALKRTPWISQNLPGVESFVELVRLVLPALLIVASFLDTACNFFLGRLIGRRLGIAFPDVPPFSEWRLPRSVLWAFVLGWVCIFFGGSTILGKIGLNLQVVTQLLFLFQGLSLVYYFLGKHIHSKVITVSILIFLLFQPLLSSLLSLLGMFDVLFDFRRLGTKR